MNRLIKYIYLMFATFMIIIFLFLNINYYDSERIVNDEIKHTASTMADHFDSEVTNWVIRAKESIEDAHQVIEMAPNDDAKIREFLGHEMEKHPEFTLIYYGRPDGTLIMTTDWDEPDDFILTNRPWYLKASESGCYVMTEPFKDAYSGQMVVSMSMPVYDDSHQLLGVISGDIETQTIMDNIVSFNDYTRGYAFVMNQENDVIFNWGDPPSVYLENDLITAASQGLVGIEKADKFVDSKLEGFVQVSPISHTPWTLLAYVPTDAYSNGIAHLRWVMNVMMVISFLAFIVIYYLQKRYISNPLLEFEKQVADIDIEFNSAYRINLKSTQFLGRLQNKINELLESIFQYVTVIENDQEEVHALNEELEASFGQLVATEQEVTRQKMYFESLFKNSPEAVAMFDQEHRIVDINGAFTGLFGYELREIRGKDLDDILTLPDEQMAAKEKTQMVFEGVNVSFEALRYGVDNQPRQVSVKGVKVTYEGTIVGGYGIYSDISKRIEREHHLEYVGNHDYLTGLYNRYYFEKKLSLISQEDLPVAIIMIDVNGLKLINDAFGNDVGDELLIKTAEVVENMARDVLGKDYFVSRIGGDEFTIVKCGMENESVVVLVQRIKEETKKIKIGEIEVSVSIGWGIKNNDESMQAVLKIAEDNLLRHKLTENPSIRGKTIDTIMNTLHEKSPREEQHSKRVSELSYRIALEMGLDDRSLNEIKTMGLLHDVGKIAISDKILNKEGRLTDVEYEEIKRHPEIGYRILSSVNELAEMANAILAHHEKWDGSGYPKGLKGEEIPYLARIIAIADAFDAMTSNRSYREALSYEEALEEIKRFSNIQFDPEVVGFFTSYIESEMAKRDKRRKDTP